MRRRRASSRSSRASEALQVFKKQFGLLRKRLLSDPKSLRQVFIDDGTHAIVWEFQQDQLGADFTKTLWNLLLRDDDMSLILQRFIWALPLKFKRKFIAALDAHLSDRYPMFKGLSKGWPAESFIPPYVRPADERAHDFDLVTMGYLGYRTLGYSPREVDLLVWLEVLRDKQCDDRPCEVGVLLQGRKPPKGGCPVKIHIPEMLDLLGTGRFKEALKLIEELQSAAQRHRPRLPAGAAVPGRVHHQRPADRDRPARMVPARARAAERQGERQRPGRPVEGLRHPVAEGREAADRGGRLRSRRPDQRLSAVDGRLPGHRVRGVP